MTEHVTKISIITLTYNNWRIMKKAISSVLKQKIDNKYIVEYIIVDDGTADFDITHVQSLLDETEFQTKIIVNSKNIGTVASFNNAIKESIGDIVIPLSADDEFYADNVVNDIAVSFNKHKSLVVTGIRVPSVDGIELEPLPPKKLRNLFNSKSGLLKRLLIHGNFISGASTYYHKKIFQQVGFFDESYTLLEDYPFYIECLRRGFNIDFLDKPVIKYGINGISSSINMHPTLLSDYKILNSRLLKGFKLSTFEKRRIIFVRILNRSQKKKIKNIILYPEQYIISILTKIFIC